MLHGSTSRPKEEKNDREIFQVVAWLGRGNKNTQRVVEFVEKLSRVLEDMRRKE